MKKIFILLLLLHTANTSANKLHLDDLNLVGRSNFSVWFWDIYDIELKTPSGTYEEGKRPLSLELTYKRVISNVELVDETLTQLKRFNISEEQKKNWAKQLLKIWPSVKPTIPLRFTLIMKKSLTFILMDNL